MKDKTRRMKDQKPSKSKYLYFIQVQPYPVHIIYKNILLHFNNAMKSLFSSECCHEFNLLITYTGSCKHKL